MVNLRNKGASDVIVCKTVKYNAAYSTNGSITREIYILVKCNLNCKLTRDAANQFLQVHLSITVRGVFRLV